jgi:glycosyltransferase involved in cell wall biosynthesis
VTDEPRVSIVVATRNRSRDALAKAQWALAQKACAEAIFVVDGADDDTVPRLTELAGTDARLRVLPLERRTGLPGARNVGIRAAISEWLLLIDDDDLPSEGFLEALLSVAEAADATIVGAPWFNLTDGRDLEAFIATAPRRPGGPALDRPGFFPERDWEVSLWFTVNALFRRSVFDEISFDRGYRGNYYREDTDFLVSAARAGHRVVVTSLAYTFLRKRVAGGVDRRRKLVYEYWVLRNNWRFLRKHGRWLREAGHIRGTVREQVALVVRRAGPIARAAARRLSRPFVRSADKDIRQPSMSPDP